MTESVKYHDICDDCMHKGYCDMAQFGGHNPHITACSHFIAAKQTNADRIRQMSDEELADWLVMNGNGEDYKGWLEWLKEEAKT